MKTSNGILQLDPALNSFDSRTGSHSRWPLQHGITGRLQNDSRGAATAFVVELARKRKVTVPGGFVAEDLRRLIEVLESC